MILLSPHLSRLLVAQLLAEADDEPAAALADLEAAVDHLGAAIRELTDTTEETT